MSLVENTLFGIRDKVEIAIARLREFEPEEGYYLAFSGGKDSQCIYHLAVKAGVKFDAHFNLTTVDPPELIKFIKAQYPDVAIHKPPVTMWKLIPQKLMPPTRRVRYCCEYLKEHGGAGRMVVTGIRWAESARRSKRQVFEQCMKAKHKTFIHPIIDWSTPDVWEYIKSRNLPYCSLYDEGQTRIGCILCPMQSKKARTRDIKRYPTYYRAYLRAFEKMLAERNKRGFETTMWNTAQDVMDWWIHGNADNGCNGNPDQTALFE
jgi:phosphoadenosine phosphosulfate reductase